MEIRQIEDNVKGAFTMFTLTGKIDLLINTLDNNLSRACEDTIRYTLNKLAEFSAFYAEQGDNDAALLFQEYINGLTSNKTVNTVGNGKYIDGRDRLTAVKPNLGGSPKTDTDEHGRTRKTIRVPLNVFQSGTTNIGSTEFKTDGSLFVKEDEQEQ